MKFGIVTKTESRPHKIHDLIKYYNVVPCTEDPDFITVVGGDGSILYAERIYPGIPKITFRDSSIGSKCMYDLNQFEHVMGEIIDGRYELIEENKICIKQNVGDIIALNEIQLHNKNPTSAVRFSVETMGRTLYKEIIGDGVIISTSFGSSGYFKSVGGKPFESRYFGIALNNPYNYSRDYEIFYSDKLNIKLIIHRGQGLIVADNDQNFIYTGDGDEFIIEKSESTAKFVRVEI